MVRRGSSQRRHSSRSSPPGPTVIHRRFGCRLGCISRERPSVRLVVSRLFDVFYQPLRAPGGSFGCTWVPPSSYQSIRGPVFRQRHRSGLPSEGGWYPLFKSEFSRSSDSSPLRITWSSSAPPVYSGVPQCPSGLSQPGISSLRLRMDTLSGGLL